MEKVRIGKMIKSSAEAGWAVFSKLQMLHVSSGAGPSEGGVESVITNQSKSFDWQRVSETSKFIVMDQSMRI